MLNFIGNIFILVGLKIFGDNYYGFRIPIVITMFFIFFIIFLCFREIDKKYEIENKKEKLFFLFILVTNFILYNASRIVEPTVFRMLFVSLICYVFLKFDKNNKLRSFLIGLLTSISMFLVYITNSFLCIGFLFFIIYLYCINEKKKAKECLAYGLLGIILGCGVSQLYYSFWNTNFLANTFKMMNDFQGSSMYSFSQDNYLLSVLNRSLSFFTSNFMMFCPFFLIGIIISIYKIKSIFKSNNERIIFSLFLIISLFFQTLITEDFINRKIIVLLPILCIYFYEVLIISKNKKINVSKWMKMFLILFLSYLYIMKFFYGKRRI